MSVIKNMLKDFFGSEVSSNSLEVIFAKKTVFALF